MPDPLKPTDFPAFYRHVHGSDPFPWQADLAAQVLTDGRWPDLVDVPTGLGKTSLIDIAVFVAAATADQPGPERTGRRRCFFVVDRRIVVDEAHSHATVLAGALQEAEGTSSTAGRVAARLRSFAPDAGGELLPVTRMRGGSTWDAAWLDRPDRPGVVLGTVDQVGSRLLFRGYGVSDRRRPLDAALVGTDSLVLVDEAHLATALLTTVAAARRHDVLGPPLPGVDVVRLSATGEATERTYRLDPQAHHGHVIAWQRLTAAKRLTIRASTARTCARDIVDSIVEQLSRLDGSGAGAPVALAVCNTVDRAREVHTLLGKAAPELDRELLIGRSRPLDRPELQHQVLDRFGTGRTPSARSAVLVATQTVEVGINLDADVLVTESASWDALVQRLGRLNRLGRFGDRFPGHDAAPAIVVHDGQEDGPVYGTARDATWSALRNVSTDTGLDVSPLACRDLTATSLASPELSQQPKGVPVLLEPILDAWTHTAPVPLNDPPVAPYLHGFDSGAAAVEVLWRDGLVETDTGVIDAFDDNAGAERSAAQLDALLTLWPPRTGEIVVVPFVAARRWISGLGTGPVGDVESASEPEQKTAQLAEPFRVLAQRTSSASDSPTAWRWIDAEDLRPGDRIVVPCERGGLDRHGWAPTDPNPVINVSEAAAFTPSRSRREAALRLDPGLLSRLGIEADHDLAAAVTAASSAADGQAEPDVTALARRMAKQLPPVPPSGSGWSDEAWESLGAWLSRGRLRLVEVRDPSDPWSPGDVPSTWAWLLAGPRPTLIPAVPAVEGDDEQVGGSSVGSAGVSLDVHQGAVAARAVQIARALGLPSDLELAVEDAARWHDLGKCDTRFQVMLHGGDGVEAALAVEPLAKSGLDPTDRVVWKRAARQSRLPAGARHEAWSAALVEEHLRHHPHPGDADLLVHLVASHHGYGRPWPRLVIDSDPRPVEAVVDGEKTVVSSAHTVSLDQPGRFARLNHRYGRWGLALLEAVVRCADTTVSGEGS